MAVDEETYVSPRVVQTSTETRPIPDDAPGKALSLNLDPSIYGTIAEVGAGQEVARWFLGVGAASGTVARTICAYDKRVSDDIYGAGTRYVSKERLLAMLDHEYEFLVDRLNTTRGDSTCFFAFADTVATRNYQGTNEQHGWLGLRFQSVPGAPPSQVLLHINLCALTAQLQQQDVGVLGVNLIYAAFHQRSDADTFLRGLFDELSIAQLEIDVIELGGPCFAEVHSGSWCLELLRHQMAHALVFDSEARVVEPSTVLRKRPLLVIRGSFSHPDLFKPELFRTARKQLVEEGVSFERPPADLLELTVHHASRVENLPVPEMLACIEQLACRGSVIVSDYPETYLLSLYLRRHSTEPVRFILSAAAAAKTMHEAFYRTLPGALLEGIGRLLATNVKLYVTPMSPEAFRAAMGDLPVGTLTRDSHTGDVALDDLAPPGTNLHLFNYLRSSGRIVGLT